MDDRAIAEGCRRGHRAAWEEFVHRYTRFLTFAVRRQMRNPPEEVVNDVVQNIFLELLKDNGRAWARYDPKYRLTTSGSSTVSSTSRWTADALPIRGRNRPTRAFISAGSPQCVT